MIRVVFIIGLLALISSGFFLKKSPADFPQHIPAPIYSYLNYSSAQIELGRALFFDPVLSRDSSISCATCHSPYHAFAHVDHRLSHGINDHIGKRNAPALFNLAWQQNLMWDGAANHPEVQPISPISNPDEMDENLNHVVEKLSRSPRYESMFETAFGHQGITGQTVLVAIASFQLSITSFESKYDQVKTGKTHFTDQENAGYLVFDKHCNSCHREPLFSTFAFANNGLAIDEDLMDIGRMKISGDPKDSLHFKIPSLRNLKYSAPYMHDGRFNKLSEVLQHYESGIVMSSTLSKEVMNGIMLTAKEKTDLTAFLLTLNDSAFVFNPQYQYPKQLLREN